MVFRLEHKLFPFVTYVEEGENLLGIRLDDGTILYADGATRGDNLDDSSDLELVFPVDLLPVSVHTELLEEVGKLLTHGDSLTAEEAAGESWAQQWEFVRSSNTLYYDRRLGGWRLSVKTKAPMMIFYSVDLEESGLEGFGLIAFASDIKEVFLTTRDELARTSL